MRSLKARRRRDRLLRRTALGGSLLVFLVPAVFMMDLVVDGMGVLSLDFLTGIPSRFPREAGIGPAFLGTLWILFGTACVAVPLGLGTALYLEEFATGGWLSRGVRAWVTALARVPSVVLGILGLALFARGFELGASVMAGVLTLSLLVTPMIIQASREAITSVPPGMRDAAYALGATRWQVVRHRILPLALPGILSGTLLALARGAGEAAPFIMIGVLAFVPFSPEGLDEPFTVLPVQIFHWITRGEEFHGLAAGGILVLMALLLSLSVLAIYIRERYGSPGQE